MLVAQVVVIDLIFLVIVGVFLAVLLAVIAQYARLWFQAYMSGVRVSLPRIVGMRLRKVNPTVVVRTLIMTKQSGIELSPNEVELAYFQGADVTKIAMALIRATREGRDITFKQLVEADLDEGTQAYD